MNIDKEIIVSIYSLAYNHEKYIRSTLEGFVHQKTTFKFEVIIHDDASTDKTADIIKEYETQYPNLIFPIYQEENQYSKGVKIGKTYIYPKCNGRYIAYCECDDYWTDENKLQKQYEAMELNPGCSICVHKIQCINEDGSISKDIFPKKSYNFHGGVITKWNLAEHLFILDMLPFQLSSFFIRRDVIIEPDNRLPIFNEYLIGDQVLLRLALKNGDFYYIEQVMSCYRKGAINSWTQRAKQMSSDKLIQFNLSAIKGDILYNEYTNFKFHDLISNIICSRTVLLADFDIKLAKKMLAEYSKYTKKYMTSKESIFHKCKYIVLRYTPKSFYQIFYTICLQCKRILNKIYL